MNDSDEPFVTIHTLTNQFEADLLVGALEQEDIPVLLRTFEETPYDGLFVAQRGWGWIQVPQRLEAPAREIVARVVRETEGKRIYDDPEDVDPFLWEQLSEADPEKVCVQAQVQYDAATHTYRFPFLSSSCACNVDQRSIDIASEVAGRPSSFELYLVILHYLLESSNQPLSGKWISEKDIPGGELFFKGPHQFPVNPLLKLFGRDRELFRKAAESLGGSAVQMGDAAYRLWPLPRIPLLFVLWEGDDEFEPALHVRFDATIVSQLRALDTIWAMINVVCRNFREAAKAHFES